MSELSSKEIKTSKSDNDVATDDAEVRTECFTRA